MKATVIVRLKPEVLDPQGDAVRRALSHLGVQGLRSVRIGRLIEIEIEGNPSADEVRARLEKAGQDLLSNPVIEDYEIAL